MAANFAKLPELLTKTGARWEPSLNRRWSRLCQERDLRAQIREFSAGDRLSREDAHGRRE